MLSSYLTNTANLLQTPGAPTSLYSTANLTLWVNIARGQLAGESQSIRTIGTISTVIGQRNYNFSSINIGTASATGIQGIIHIRRVMYAVGSGYQWMRPRNWEWFDLYKLNNPVPPSGPPEVWAQYAQGSQGTASISIRSPIMSTRFIAIACAIPSHSRRIPMSRLSRIYGRTRCRSLLPTMRFFRPRQGSGWERRRSISNTTRHSSIAPARPPLRT